MDVVPLGPPAEMVAELVAFGFDPAKVRRWSFARAFTTLEASKKAAAVALARAEPEKKPERGKVPGVIRKYAAEYLRECLLSGGPDNLAMAVSMACCHLQDDEVRRLAEFMAGKFREG